MEGAYCIAPKMAYRQPSDGRNQIIGASIVRFVLYPIFVIFRIILDIQARPKKTRKMSIDHRWPRLLLECRMVPGLR